MGILRLGHVEVEVTDLDLAARFYTDVVGLDETARDDDHSYLKAHDENDHHSVVLSRAPVAGLGHVGWKVTDAEDLARLETRLERTGCAPRRLTPAPESGLGDGVRFETPTGHEMELFHQVRKLPRERRTSGTPLPWDPPGIAPIRLEHVALTTGDVDGLGEFLSHVLGFRVTGRVPDASGRTRALHLERSHQAVDVAVHHGTDGGLRHLGFRIAAGNGLERVAAALRHDDLTGASGPGDDGSKHVDVAFLDPAGNGIALSSKDGRVDPDDEPIVRTASTASGRHATGAGETNEESVEVRLIRHGQTKSYAADAGLTPLGRDQAYDKGAMLAAELSAGASVRLPHAPTARAQETAVALREGLLHGIAKLGTPAVVGGPDPDEWFANLRVWADGVALDPTQAYGPYQDAKSAGRENGDLSGWTVEMRRWAAVHAAGGDPIAYWLTHPLQYFEPAAAVVRRFWLGIARLIEGANPNDHLFVCTHSGCIRAVATAAFGYDPGEPLNVEDVLIRAIPGRQHVVVTYRGRCVRQPMPTTESAPWHIDEPIYIV